uniref:Transcription factor Pur-alpha 1 n=1 Tax=Chenopodium quinoa TaxID=63459 RepID=A0A803N9I9_CHEQI
MCKTLQVEHKLFYFDLKENPRGRYLKISEKTSATRSTIIVPSNGISWFLDLFNYYVNSEDQDIFSKELQLDAKVFYFDVGENRRGRFLKDAFLAVLNLENNTTAIFIEVVSDADPDHTSLRTARALWLPVSEASMSRNRSTIIIPAGSTRDEGWAAFRNILAEINEALRLFVMSNQQNSEASERLVGLSDDVGAGFIAGHSTQSTPATEITVDRSADLPAQDEISSNLGASKVIRVDQKRFFFDLGSNNRGHFLRISEVAGPDRSSIILPLSGLKQFYEMVAHFMEISKDKIEGMASANVRTVDPPQR